MLYNEFIKLQEQVKDILVNYTYFLKKGAQLNFKYTASFKDEILKDFKIRNENTMLITAITMLNDKKKLEEVDNYINDYKKNYSKDLINLNNRIIASTNILNNELTLELKEELEKHFVELVKNYYPALRLEENSEYIKAFELLQSLYQQNNYNTYFASYELFKNLFTLKDYHGVDFDRYATIYMNLMQQITTDTVKRKQAYPYIKEEVFEDEISLAREKGDFKARINKLLEANASIKKDFVEIYGEMVELD